MKYLFALSLVVGLSAPATASLIQTATWTEASSPTGPDSLSFSGELILEFDKPTGTQEDLVGCSATGTFNGKEYDWGNCNTGPATSWTYEISAVDWTISFTAGSPSNPSLFGFNVIDDLFFMCSSFAVNNQPAIDCSIGNSDLTLTADAFNIPLQPGPGPHNVPAPATLGLLGLGLGLLSLRLRRKA